MKYKKWQIVIRKSPMLMTVYKCTPIPCVFAMLMFVTNCTTKKNYQSNVSADAKPFILKFERGPCFGRCPVYSFYLLDDHTGLVNAKGFFLDSAGWYSSNLDQESIAEILELIEPREWWLPNLQNQPEISDLPSSSLVYQHPLVSGR